MRIIEKISKRIEDEIKDAKDYTMLALEIRDEYPDMSRTLYTISMQEMEHMRMLHDGVAAIITKMRNEGKAIPEQMMTLYNYLHEKHIEEAAEAKLIQAMYK